MKAASSSELKQELKSKTPAQLLELCLRLARFKKENKELLTYLLFEADDEEEYIKNIRLEMDELFETVNISHLYFAKKTLRKILRNINKYIRYTGSKTVELELLLHYCIKIKELNINLKYNSALFNLYNTQVKKARAALATLHEDIQYEYAGTLDNLALS